ncbi:MAG: RecQ family zinc-binding domain-containing protein, partial [Bacteroidales bacterium]|nr:RecQ family zinc-binding domain-containing protein [Bacteroidales bacterium]
DAPEAYFQEAGRAGRDGKPAYAVLIYNKTDIGKLRRLASTSFPSLEYIENVYHLIMYWYDIPYDTGEGRSLKFDLGDFATIHHLSFSELKYAIDYICKTGHWSYEDSRDIQTRVRIICSRADLYDVNFSDAVQPEVMETLMRKYPTIFYSVTTIDEDYVASVCNITPAELHRTLYNLSLAHLVNYIPSSQSGIITLNYNRLAPKNVNLDPAKYEFLKKTFIERSTKMIDYATFEGGCRTAFLLDYFGEENAKPCGKCDLCRADAAKKK